MGVLNTNEIGVLRMTVGEYYEVGYRTFSGNAVAQTADMISAKEYPVEDMPGIFELYIQLQKELRGFGFSSMISDNTTWKVRNPGVKIFLKVTDKNFDDIGYIYILNRN